MTGTNLHSRKKTGISPSRRLFPFCSILFLLLSGHAARGQQAADTWHIAGKSLPALQKEGKEQIGGGIMRVSPVYPMGWQYALNPRYPVPGDTAPSAVVTRGFAINDLAFFCRIEHRMEKALRFPFKIRLGEVQYVEEMEGKINSMKTNPSRR